MTQSTMNLSQFKYKTSIEIRFVDLDMFGHVNNAIYLTYFEIARSKYWNEIIEWDWKEMGIIIARSEIDYIIPVLLQDHISVYVRTSRIGNSSFDIEYIITKSTGSTEVICAKGKTVCVTFNYKENTTAAIPQAKKQKMQTYDNL